VNRRQARLEGAEKEKNEDADFIKELLDLHDKCERTFYFYIFFECDLKTQCPFFCAISVRACQLLFRFDLVRQLVTPPPHHT
jgi:hypothetical protein